MGPRALPPTLLVVDVEGLTADAKTIDALARLALVARRHGCRPRLWRASDELRELIEFVGLGEVLVPPAVTPGSTAPKC
jgi:hypothetical protein